MRPFERRTRGPHASRRHTGPHALFAGVRVSGVSAKNRKGRRLKLARYSTRIEGEDGEHDQVPRRNGPAGDCGPEGQGVVRWRRGPYAQAIDGWALRGVQRLSPRLE